MRSCRTALLLILLVLLTAPAHAQTVSVRGRVADPQGGAVLGAEVTLTAVGAAGVRTSRTSEDGSFVFDGVAPARYVVQVTSPGFVRWNREVTVSGAVEPLVVTLEVAGVTEEVTVSGAIATNLTREAPTASRLGLTPLETPATVQVLSGSVIRERGDVLVSDATTRTAGVTSTAGPGNGGTALSYRGFSGHDSVLQLYDGLQLFVGSGTSTFPFDPWTVERIDVLGGPSSVLYGTGAVGGAVNVIARRPNPASFEHNARVSAGSHNTYRGAFGSGGPINNRLSYRVDLSRNASDGWIDRGDSSSTAVSASLRLVATPTWTLTFSEDFGLQRPAYDSGTPFIDGRIDPERRLRNYNVLNAEIKTQDNWTQVKSEWAPSANVTMRTNVYTLSTHRDWHGLGAYAFDPFRQQIRRSTYFDLHHDQRQYGGYADALFKSRLAGRDNHFSVGLDYNWVRFRHENADSSGTSFVDLDNTDPGVFITEPGRPFASLFQSRSNRYAVFAEDRLALSPRLSAVAGVRVERAEVNRVDFVTNTTSDKAFNPATWRGGLVYMVTPGISAYGQFSTATDAVGSLVSLSAAQQTFKLTTGRQVEAGVKQAFLGNRGEWTAAVYRIVKNNLVTRDPDDPTIQLQIGEQSSQGVEGSAALSLPGNLRVEANGTWLRARFDDFVENVGGVNVSRVGNRPTNVPAYTANMWVTWSATAQWQARGGLRYVGDRFANTANNYVMPQYTVVDAGVRRVFMSKHAIDLRVYNAFDKIYALSPRGSVTAPQWLLGRPRSVEVTWTANF